MFEKENARLCLSHPRGCDYSKTPSPSPYDICEFSSNLDSSLSISLTAGYCLLARLSTALSRLRLRQTACHCPAAFLASKLASQDMCRTVDPAFQLGFGSFVCNLALAAADLSSQAFVGDNFEHAEKTQSQQRFSCCLDKRSLANKENDASHYPTCAAHLTLTGAPWAGA